MTRSFDRRKLVAARLAAAEQQPFLAEALYALSPVAAPHVDTFGVDERWRLMVNPERLDEWTVPEVAGVLLHEVGHLVRDHAGRSRTLGVRHEERVIWNIAGDAEINEDLLRDDVVLPESRITPELLGLRPGQVAEYYFRELIERNEPVEDPPHCGSGCTGADDDEQRAPLMTNDLPPGLGPGEQVLLRRRIALAVAQGGAYHGDVGGGWSRWAEALLDPVIDWRPLLRGAVRQAIGEIRGMVDYSYRRPARRRLPGIVLPAMSEPTPVITVVVDTSGSMSDDHLNAAWTEVQEAIKAVGVRRELVKVLMNDVEVELVERPFGSKVELRGGGGTDLRNGIAHAMGLRPRPGLLIVLTDGYTPWPDKAPPARVVIGLIRPAADNVIETEEPEWAVTVRIELE